MLKNLLEELFNCKIHITKKFKKKQQQQFKKILLLSSSLLDLLAPIGDA